jgi:1-acyl-sn-glycerol-3-phosphate acyltransferase
VNPVRHAARQAVSLWCWAYLVVTTAGWVSTGVLLSTVRDPHKSFGWILRSWAGGIMRWGFHRCEVRGASGLPCPAVLLVNHQSGFDIALISYLVPPPLFFVARLEVGRVPLIGSVLRGGGHVFVRRGAGQSNEAAFDEAAARLREGGCVVFFGEGTRSRGDEVLPLRSGAFRLAARAGVPLIPLVLAGTRGTLPPGGWPIAPFRLAAEFLAPRTVTDDDARSASFREDLRHEMQAALTRLLPGTGPRI